MRNVTLKQLRSVQAIARRGTVAHAARDLFLTGPAITMQLRQLEQEVGLALFDRTSDGMLLTDAGRAMVEAANRIDAVMTECWDRMSALKGLEAGHVAIGVVSTAKYFAPRAIAAFARLHPRIETSLFVGNRLDILSALRENRVDIVLMGRPPLDLDTVHARLGDHPLVVIAHPDHPLARRRALPRDALQGQYFLLRETGSGTRASFEAFLAEAPDLAQSIHLSEMGSNETIKQAVMAGLGIAFLSAHTIEAEAEAGRLAILDVEGTPVNREWFVLRRADRDPSPATAAFEGFLIAESAAFLPAMRRFLPRR
jgi:DNA-binding transcriptional LysR family regulator